MLDESGRGCYSFARMPLDAGDLSSEANVLIAEALAPHYVYLLVDPKNNEIFYVGKGTDLRYAAHFEDTLVGDDDKPPAVRGAKAARIAAIRDRGQRPEVTFVRRKIRTAQEAHLVEAALIDVLREHGDGGLTNLVRGHGSDRGLVRIDDLARQVAAPALETSLPALLIKLKPWVAKLDPELPRAGYGYRADITEQELYDSARAWWPLDARRVLGCRYAVAIYKGVTRAAWEIDHATWRADSSRPPKRGFEGRLLKSGEDAWADFVGPLV